MAVSVLSANEGRESTMQASQTSPPQSPQQELQDMLQTLPDKVSYPIMVPFGSVAFFPGRLIHTNECMVDLGGDTMVEMSAKETVQLLRARQSKAGASIPNTAVTQTASQNFPAQTQDTVSVQQAHQSAPQSAQQPAEQLVQQATGSFDDQILEIMEEYDEAVHGRLQKAQPEDTASTAHLGKAPTASLPADKSPCQLPRQQTAQRDAKSATQSQQHEEQRFQQIVSSAMHSKLLSKSAEPKQRSASEASAMAEQQKQSSHKQLMPQEQPQEQPPMRKQLQQQQQQACVQDDGDFECMMARFDELARQEAATSSGDASEELAVNASIMQQAPASASITAAAATAATSSRDSNASQQGTTSSFKPQKSRGRSAKSNTGFKRGFFAPPKAKATAAASKTESAASVVKESQPSKDEQPQATAFTGKVMEHSVALDAHGSSPNSLASMHRGIHDPSEVPAAASIQPEKRVSKFKQARRAKQNG